MKFFIGSTALLSCGKTMSVWAKTTEKMNKVQLYFQQLKEKLAYRYFFSMSDEEPSECGKLLPVFLLYSF